MPPPIITESFRTPFGLISPAGTRRISKQAGFYWNEYDEDWRLICEDVTYSDSQGREKTVSIPIRYYNFEIALAEAQIKRGVQGIDEALYEEARVLNIKMFDHDRPIFMPGRIDSSYTQMLDDYQEKVHKLPLKPTTTKAYPDLSTVTAKMSF